MVVYRGIFLSLMIGVRLLGGPAIAQGDPTPPLSPTPTKQAGFGSGAPVSIIPAPDSTPEFKDALKEYYYYSVFGYHHNKRVVAWQHLSSQIIFVLVIFLVLVGVYFSWLQFRSAMRGGTEFANRPPDTTFEASATGLKVSSPILGVIILALSLAFLDLYLIYVYPITEIPLSPAVQPVPAGQP